MPRERKGKVLENFIRRNETRARRLAHRAERRASDTFGLTKSGKPRKATADQLHRRAEQALKIESKRMTRMRKRNFKKRKGEQSPTEAGARQFGGNAKAHHLHQRENRLAVALTPEEFKRQETERKQPEKKTLDKTRNHR